MSRRMAAFGEVMMRLQVPGYELLKQANTLQYSFSGTGVNVLAALSHFGHKGYLVSALPPNALGDAAVSYLRKLGIEDTYVSRCGHEVGMYFLENGFGARPSRVTYANRSLSSFNTASTKTFDLPHIIKNVEVIHFCGIALAMNTQVRKTMITLGEMAKEKGCMVVFDCNYRPLLWGDNGHEKARPYYEQLLHLADIVIMNEKDAIHTLKMETTKMELDDQIKELMTIVAEKYQISVIAGTNRKIESHDKHTLRGFIHRNKKTVFSSIRTFPVFDRIGSGDAFSSGIIHGVVKGFDSRTTVEFATVASMLAHSVVGDTPVSTENDIVKVMEGTIGDIER
ncbi:sugar kinase [Halalkalibacter hemicellulosilyticus]|uniref:Carbohydrate kinase n=1 Tax=Halalkalibacter hemicellulosilyticusJCM 9152 TaxID=1236971 RepID=W4QL87_9BACI|nr:sugar kinase [Halalkalibacter hemicellulosilyticus]GAE32851.1 carbohydrate kinase [Halalkalibacter hemicellulosilyticusJCM 9152]